MDLSYFLQNVVVEHFYYEVFFFQFIELLEDLRLNYTEWLQLIKGVNGRIYLVLHLCVHQLWELIILCVELHCAPTREHLLLSEAFYFDKFIFYSIDFSRNYPR